MRARRPTGPSPLRALLLCVALLLGCSPTLRAAPWVRGDVFLGVFPSSIQVYDGTTLIQKDIIDLSSVCSTAEVAGGAFSPDNTLLYITCFQAEKVVIVNATGTTHNIVGSFDSIAFGAANPESIAFDRDGNLLVGHASGSKVVLKHSPNGTVLDSYTVATEDRGSDWVDLDSGGNNLIYTSEGSTIFNYTLATRTQNAPFATGLTRPCFALRVLPPDNSVLVACAPCVYLLSPAGAIKGQFCPPAGELGGGQLFGANVFPDGKRFVTGVIGGSNRVFVVPFDRINETTGFANFTPSPSGAVAGIVVLGEITTRGQCTAGSCCNTTSGTFKPPGTPCGTTPNSNPCVAQQCTGTNATCPSAATPLPNNTACAFVAPTPTNKCKDRTSGSGSVTSCPKAKKNCAPPAPCQGTCQAGSCVLQRGLFSNSKCCKLPGSGASSGHDKHAKNKNCFCWR